MLFQRTASMRALPVPVAGGNVEMLQDHINVRTDDDFALVVAWLTAALRDRGPYPVLSIAGEPGSAKSTLATRCRALVDPAGAALRTVPRNEQDMWVGAANSAVVALDSYWDEPRTLDAELRTALLSHTDKSTTHQLQGVHGGRENVSLYLWLDSESQMFDAELVFWSDQLFPEPDDESTCLQTFEQYVDLAEKIRSLSAGSQCVISASETGDPRDDRGKPWTCWW